MQKTFADTIHVNVGFGGRRRNKEGGFDLEITPLDEKTSQGLDDPGPEPEVGFPGRQSALLRPVGTIL